MEVTYLFFAFLFLFILSIGLTVQIYRLWQIESSQYNHFNQLHKKKLNEFSTYIVSQILIEKKQRIEAIQILQLTLARKQSHDSCNKYSLASLCNTISCVYKQLYQFKAATYYLRLASLFDDKYLEASENLIHIYGKISNSYNIVV
uniref:Transmembrane protein n=1 Tax=Apophlaea sinclairii TaxID=212746 RepID=A0A1C9CBQ6_9FLOR|nr:hypothetical protein Apop_115 [Apophlaea sinclairii]AOM65805.1 hypothetical protein Apop_115 [Apophlaea sinclairii]